jgi:hypothetical protein
MFEGTSFANLFNYLSLSFSLTLDDLLGQCEWKTAMFAMEREHLLLIARSTKVNVFLTNLPFFMTLDDFWDTVNTENGYDFYRKGAPTVEFAGA